MSSLNIRKFTRANRLGFTLIEVLVAIMVFASLSVTGYAVVNQVVRSNQQSLDKTHRIEQLQRALIILDGDFRQMVARRFRSNGEEASQDLLHMSEYLLDSESKGIVFVRAGWQNPQQAFPRGDVTKVGYRVMDGKLQRVWWNYPDTGVGLPPLQREILDKVDSLDFRFYTGSEWQTEWDTQLQLPKAVELILQLQDYGKISRIYPIAAGALSASGGDYDEDNQ